MTNKQPKPKILHVDDDPLQRGIISMVLTRKGFDVKSAGNGQDGVTLAVEWTPDLILMDIMMPVMDGLVATRHLRNNPYTQHIPILALTAANDAETRTNARAAGVNELLVKTMPATDLVQTLQFYLFNGHSSRKIANTDMDAPTGD